VRHATWLLLLLACGGDDDGIATLRVDLRTDLVPGVEFQAVVLQGDGFREDAAADLGEDWTTGRRVATLELPRRAHRFSLSVRDAGASIFDRTVSVALSGGDLGITVVVDRGCLGVECAEGLACSGGSCVPDSCVAERAEECGPDECVPAECPPRASCLEASCVLGGCFYTELPMSCAAGQYCDPDTGCTALPGDAGPPVDAGPLPDAGPIPDAGPLEDGSLVLPLDDLGLLETTPVSIRVWNERHQLLVDQPMTPYAELPAALELRALGEPAPQHRWVEVDVWDDEGCDVAHATRILRFPEEGALVVELSFLSRPGECTALFVRPDDPGASDAGDCTRTAPCASIDRAFTVAAALADRVVVHVDESVSAYPPLSLDSRIAGASEVVPNTLRALPGSGRPTLEGGGATVLDGTTANLVIDGFTLDGGGTSAFGARLAGPAADDVILRHLEVRAIALGGWGVFTDSTTSVDVQHCHIHDVDGGILVDDPVGGLLNANLLEDLGAGIQVDFRGAGGLRIEENTVCGAVRDSVLVDGAASPLLLRNNLFVGAETDGIRWAATASDVVFGNTFVDGLALAFVVAGGSTPTLGNNLFLRNAGAPVIGTVDGSRNLFWLNGMAPESTGSDPVMTDPELVVDGCFVSPSPVSDIGICNAWPNC